MGLSQADAANVIVLFSDFGKIRRFCVQPVPGRPTKNLSARRRRTTTVPQLVADHFQSIRKKISATTVVQEDQLASTDLEEQRTRYHQSNTVERVMWWNPGLEQGSRYGHTGLHVFHGGTVTGLRYRDETLDPYVRPYAAAIGNDFILMDDNARPHRARIVEEYLEDPGLERMEWPARSPDLN
ncbi:transposable element Tcb2 transposase [Trichonephila clavipes]|nr:transposable element Tcb2 transposase [Trichonephila clavipes]